MASEDDEPEEHRRHETGREADQQGPHVTGGRVEDRVPGLNDEQGETEDDDRCGEQADAGEPVAGFHDERV